MHYKSQIWNIFSRISTVIKISLYSLYPLQYMMRDEWKVGRHKTTCMTHEAVWFCTLQFILECTWIEWSCSELVSRFVPCPACNISHAFHDHAEIVSSWLSRSTRTSLESYASDPASDDLSVHIIRHSDLFWPDVRRDLYLTRCGLGITRLFTLRDHP